MRSGREAAVVDESRKEMADRVAKHQPDYSSRKKDMPNLLVPPTGAAGLKRDFPLSSFFLSCT